MRKNFGAQPISYPQPVFMVGTYGEDGTPDVMNAAWGGIGGKDLVYICMGENHTTTRNLLARKAFTVSMATVDTLVPCDYVGLVSADKVPDKFARAGFHATPSEFVDAPIIDELPLTIECELVSYNKENWHLVGRIVNVCADESILDENGKIDPDKLKPITYDHVHYAYRVLGEKVGNAFVDGQQLK